MAYRGIGDAATEVIANQNRLGMQAAGLSEQARQFDETKKAQEAARAQQASQFDEQLAAGERARGEQSRQFDVSAGQRQQGLAEDRRQFDTGMAQRERSLSEGKRQFDLSFGRQTANDEFRMGLETMMSSAELAGRDAETQMKLAQLGQYVAATKDEESRRKNREDLAKGAFGALAIAGILNGGVMPASAIEIANRELGDKDNRIVGGGIDPESGIAFFNVAGADGAVKSLKMSPENQFSLLQTVYGDDVAGMFANKYKENASVTAAIERARIGAQKTRTEALGRAAESLAKRIADISKDPMRANSEEVAGLKAQESKYRAELNKELGIVKTGPAAVRTDADAVEAADPMVRYTEPGTRVMNEEARKQFNLPLGTEIRKDPNTGRVFAAYKKNGEWVPFYLTN